mmetsp:Transcript_5975/g.9231  ORF Transcript_5975/g.9231 Transcript_5975/m.9231 type:complete len:237 (+) Transcript_5975:984-1694(+)
MFAVPCNAAGGFAVENEAVRSLVVLPHATGNVVTSADVVAETVAFPIEDDTSFTTQGFSSQELDAVVRVIQVDETCWMDLDVLQVNSVSANFLAESDARTVAVLAVGSGKVRQFGALVNQGAGFEQTTCTVTASCDNHGIACNSDALSTLVVVHAASHISVGSLQKLVHLGAVNKLNAVGLCFAELFVLLHQGVRDFHTRKGGSGFSAVSTRVGMTSETGDSVKSEAKRVLDPMNS